MTTTPQQGDPLAWRPPGWSDAAPAVSADLDALRARIGADLVARQGPDRNRGAVARLWPYAVAAAVGVVAMAVLGSSRTGTALLPVGTVGAAAALSMTAAAVAPRRPARAERIGQAGLVVAVAALVAELLHAAPIASSPIDAHVGCFSTSVATALVPAFCVGFALVRSRVPARWFHVAPAAASALALGAAAVWRYCPHVDLGHVTAAHVVAPTLAAALLAIVYRRATQPRPLRS